MKRLYVGPKSLSLAEIGNLIRAQAQTMVPKYHTEKYCRYHLLPTAKPNHEIGFGDGMGTEFEIVLYFVNDFGQSFSWERIKGDAGPEHPILKTIVIPFDWIAIQKILNPFANTIL